MILKEIKLKNFKVFKDEQRIRFSSESGTTMITVIVGENGTGKQSLCDAIKFCLWDDTVFPRHIRCHGNDLRLINRAALKESVIAGKSVETDVCLIFKHNNQKYVLKRTISTVTDKKAKSRIPIFTTARLDISDKSGKKISLTKPEQISTVINSIFDYKVRDVFIVNCDAIAELTMCFVGRKQGLSNTIRTLLDIFEPDERHRMCLEATALLPMLFSEHSRRQFCKIIINEDFCFQSLDQENKPIHWQMSMSDGQMVIFSLILAIVKSFCAKKKYGLPLITNTPFGRLASEHREKLIKVILQNNIQWILLATPAEFQRHERELFRQSGKWGMCYCLDPRGEVNNYLSSIKKIEHYS